MQTTSFRKLLTLLLIAASLTYSLFLYRSHRIREKRRIRPNTISVGYPTTAKPDNILLTPAPDMKTMITISWRTTNSVPDSLVQFAPALPKNSPNPQPEWRETPAKKTTLFSPELVADNTIHCFSATLTGLAPGTKYRYRVGNPDLDSWSKYSTFTTEPASVQSFSFAYFGDTQTRPEFFGDMLKMIVEKHPEIAFVMIGGDLVQAGDIRNFWDHFLIQTGNVFRRKPIVITMGNHDFGTTDIGSKIAMAYFGIPPSPTKPIVPANYSFKYGNTSFLITNSEKFRAQTPWLEQELQKSSASGDAFKVAMFHYPLHRARPGRNNRVALQYWEPLFDKYNVDLLLTGHDHSYMRSHPLKGGKPVPEGEFGTVHVMATACERFYSMTPLDIAARQFGNTATGQVITLGEDENGELFMRYVAYDEKGDVVDTFESFKRVRR